MDIWTKKHHRIGLTPIERLKHRIIRLYWIWIKGYKLRPLPIHVRERMSPGKWHCIVSHGDQWWVDDVEVT